MILKIQYINLFLITLALVFLQSQRVFSQTPQWSWMTQSEGQSNESIIDMDVDPYGNVYCIGGMRQVFFDIDNARVYPKGVSLQEKSSFIAKLSPSGNIDWTMTIGGVGTSYLKLNSIVSDSAHVYVSGDAVMDSIGQALEFGGNFTIQNIGLSDISFIVKIDSTGTVIWGKDLNANSTGTISNLKMHKGLNNQLYAAGFFQDNAKLDTIDLIPYGNDAMFLAKCKDDGDFIWAKTMGSEIWDGKDLTLEVNSVGEPFVSGVWEGDTVYFDNTFLVNPTSGGYDNFDRFIAKFDTSGTLIWAVREGGVDKEEPGNLAFSDDGGTYSFSNVSADIYIDNGNMLVKGPTLLLTKYDHSGMVQFHRTYTQKSKGSHIIREGNNLIISWSYTGQESTIGGFVLSNNSSQFWDLGLAKLDLSGNVEWATNLGDDYDEFVSCLSYSSQSGLLVGGTTSSPTLSFGSHTLINLGGITVEFFIASMNQAIGLKESQRFKSIQLYPNPVSDKMWVELNTRNSTKLTCEVMNGLGQSVLERSIQNPQGHFEIDVMSLKPGVYLLQINSGMERNCIKFIKH